MADPKTITVEERVAALAQLARESGKPRAEILSQLEKGAWVLSNGESMRLRQHIATTPEPTPEADAKRAEAAAEAARQEADRIERERDAHDLATFRRYQTATPFERVDMRAANESAIERGRLIATQIPDPEPPKAA